MNARWLLAGALLVGLVYWQRTNILKAISSAGLSMIAGLEGFSATPYNDPPGSNKYSIGYGHQIQPGEVFPQEGITQDQGKALLAQDTARAQAAVRAAIKTPLTQDQFDALTSFVYNVGVAAFNNGTVPDKINAGDFQSAADTMRQYTHAGGAVNVALVARRELEAAPFDVAAA